MKLIFSLFALCLSTSAAYGAATTHTVSGFLGAFNSGIAYIADQDVDGSTTEDVSSGTNLSGLYVVGGEYTYRVSKSMGISALLKYQSTCDETDAGAETESCISMFSVGGLWRHFLRAGATEFSIGAGLMNVSPTVDGDTAGTDYSYDVISFFGTAFAIGANYEIGETTSLGVEFMNTWALSDKVQGLASQDFLVKVNFGL